MGGSICLSGDVMYQFFLLQKEETLLKKQTLTRRSNAKVVDQVIVNKAAHQMILMIGETMIVHKMKIGISSKKELFRSSFS